MIGLKPKIMRSNGVMKWRRSSADAPFGPSCGNFSRVADCVAADRLLTPSVRRVKPYAAASLIGPDTLFALMRADPFATWSTTNDVTDGFFTYFVLVSRYVNVFPFVSGK